MADPTLVHLFKVHPFGKDICDATVLENGRRRTCTRPRAEHFEEGQLEAELGRLRRGLDESVKLQSHYAELLNFHDAGERMTFASAQQWLDRLFRISTNPPKES